MSPIEIPSEKLDTKLDIIDAQGVNKLAAKPVQNAVKDTRLEPPTTAKA